MCNKSGHGDAISRHNYVSEYTAVSSHHNLHNDIHFPNYFYNVFFCQEILKYIIARFLHFDENKIFELQ